MDDCEILRKSIKSYIDFPKKGILFWDVFSALADGPTNKLLLSMLLERIRETYPTVQAVAGLEARGFLFAFALAAELGVACLPLRKKGKLPGSVASQEYQLEYGSDVIEVQTHAVKAGIRCVIVDDLIATGGSMGAAVALLRTCGAKVLGCLTVIELTKLAGRENLPEHVKLESLLKYD